MPSEIDDAQLARVLDEWRGAHQAETEWVTLAEAEEATGVSRSALRAWYRNAEIPSHMVDGPHGGQRLVDLDAVVARAAQAGRRMGRGRRRGPAANADLLQLLLDRIDELEARVEALERGDDSVDVDPLDRDHRIA